MKIIDSKTIAEIQSEFRDMFPGLKLEFYRSKHESHKGSPVDDQWPSTMQISAIRNKHNKGELILAPDMTVSNLENEFEEKFGLHVQVFRKSRNLWLQTSVTDEWTLEKQNLKGLHSMEV